LPGLAAAESLRLRFDNQSAGWALWRGLGKKNRECPTPHPAEARGDDDSRSWYGIATGAEDSDSRRPHVV
jgi:hypothetical protein